MKRIFITLFFVCICLMSITAFASESFTAPPPSPPRSTPFRLSFWPNVIGWPVDMDVYGLSLGILGSYGDSDTKVVGVDLSVIISESPNVEGLQMAIISVGKDSTGLQLSLANAADNIDGVQIGIFNAATNKSDSFQIGLINKNIKSDGFQIGALNFMDDGIFPVLPVFNYSLSKKE